MPAVDFRCHLGLVTRRVKRAFYLPLGLRAALEGIAYQTYDIVKAMERDCGLPITNLKVDGGASRNNLLMQFQSNILATEVLRPRITETTALGAAYLAGLAIGFWPSLDEIKAQWHIWAVVVPRLMPLMAPRAYWSQYGAPSPVRAGTKYTPSVSSTDAARASTSAELLMHLSPSRSHCTTEPPTNMDPSRAYETLSPIFHAIVVRSLFFDSMGRLPVFISRKHPCQ